MSSQQRKIRGGWTSISSRVTIWYSVFFILLSALLLFGIYLVSNYYITQEAQNQLEAAVVDSVGDYAEGDFEANDNGVYLSRYNNAGQLMEGAMPIPLTDQFTHNQLEEETFNDVHYLYYDYYDSDSQAWFRGVLSVQQNDQITNNLLLIIIIALPIAVVLVLGGGYWIIKRALRPIKSMSDTAQQIESKLDLSQRIPLTEGDNELYQLAKTFNSMLDKVEDSYERERQFTGDVSHELRTPISVIKSETEYAQGISGLPEEAQSALNIIQRQTRQMTKLVTSLLDMARIDHQKGIEKQRVNISQLLNEQIENYTLISEVEGKELVTIVPDKLTILGDSQMLKRLVDNLLANALKFSQKTIRLEAKQDRDGLYLTISNDGSPIPADQLDKIWNRMYQVDKSRNSTSLGLGLAFVQKIAQLHQATIQVTSENNLTTFQIFFPSSS